MLKEISVMRSMVRSASAHDDVRPLPLGLHKTQAAPETQRGLVLFVDGKPEGSYAGCLRLRRDPVDDLPPEAMPANGRLEHQPADPPPVRLWQTENEVVDSDPPSLFLNC